MKLFYPEHLCLLGACFCASIGAVTDWKSRRIPNLLTGSSMFAGLMLHLALGGWRQMVTALGAGLVCGAGFLLFFVAGGMGAGDVKMMAAVGCVAGFGSLAHIFLATVLMGGLFALAVATQQGQLKRTFCNVGALIFHHGQRGLAQHPDLNLLNSATLRLPYGIAIAAGCWITLAGQGLWS